MKKAGTDGMKLRVLVDNNTYIDRYYLGEPAVSYYIECDGIRLLFDAGYSDVFLKNAEALGIDLGLVTHMVFSHGHNDHTRGLKFMKERLELCLALVPHPRFLFLDEPQNGLDPDGIASLSETLRAYRDRGNCVVISTHLLHEIQGVPDECIVIRHGRAAQFTDLSGVNLADLYQGR